MPGVAMKPILANAFSPPGVPGVPGTPSQIDAIGGINCTVSPSLNAVVPLPYDPAKDNHSHQSRKALRLMHVRDVLNSLSFLG